MSHTSSCFIYGLVDPTTKLIRYIGLSSVGMRRPKTHRHPGKADTYCAKGVRKLQREGLDFEIIVLDEASREKLTDMERWWIAYGRALGWPLTNLTDGGPGLLNASESTRQKISVAMRIRMATPEAKARASAVAKAFWGTPEARAETAKRNKARMSTPEARAANSSRVMAQLSTPEARERLREQTRKQFATPEARAAHGAKVSARMSTPEEKARQSALTTARFASPEARKAQSDRIRAALTRPEVKAKLSGDRSPTKRADVRAKMRESSRRRWDRVAAEKRNA